jgi:hypothetical protein
LRASFQCFRLAGNDYFFPPFTNKLIDGWHIVVIFFFIFFPSKTAGNLRKLPVLLGFPAFERGS